LKGEGEGEVAFVPRVGPSESSDLPINRRARRADDSRIGGSDDDDNAASCKLIPIPRASSLSLTRERREVILLRGNAYPPDLIRLDRLVTIAVALAAHGGKSNQRR